MTIRQHCIIMAMAGAGLLASNAAAQAIDMSLVPNASSVSVCDTLEIDLVVNTNGGAQTFDAIDAVLSWDPQQLTLVGHQMGEDSNFFFWGFLPDPDGVNDTLLDGDAIFSGLVTPGQTVTVPPAPTELTVGTLIFEVSGAAPTASIELLSTIGVFGESRVLLNGANLLGTLGPAAVVPSGTFPGDIDENGTVNFDDLSILLGTWGACTLDCCPADFNHDGVIDFADLAVLLGAWG